jgi:hypothetical protein
MSGGRDLRAAGEMAGIMLAENLINLANGEVPMSDPLGGGYRKRGAEKFTLVHFAEGMNHGLQRWLLQTEWIDAFLLRHREDANELQLWVPSAPGTDKFDFACGFKYEAANGSLRTSFPGIALMEAGEAGEELCEEFLRGVMTGLAKHKRTRELGFGELGSYPE